MFLVLAVGEEPELTSFSAETFCTAELVKLGEEFGWCFSREERDVRVSTSTLFPQLVVRRIPFQEKRVVDVELDVADQVGVLKTEWQCKSGNAVTVDTKGAVLIESFFSFLAELGAYAEHGEAWRWGCVERSVHSM